MFDFKLKAGNELNELFCEPNNIVIGTLESNTTDHLFEEEFNIQRTNILEYIKKITVSPTVIAIEEPLEEPLVDLEEPLVDVVESSALNLNDLFEEQFDINDVTVVVEKSTEHTKKKYNQIMEEADTDKFINSILPGNEPKVNIDMSKVRDRMITKIKSINENIDGETIVSTVSDPIDESVPQTNNEIDYTADAETIRENVEQFIQAKELEFQEQLLKMRQDFVSLQAQINSKVNNMTMFVSSATGGGEVNMLRLDDVDTSQLSVSKPYPKYNSTTKKIEFVSASEIGQAISVTDEDIQSFTVDTTIETNQYIDLQSDIASGTEQFTELYHNGIAQDYGLTFELVNGSRNRLDISELPTVEGDHIRVRWKKA